MHSGTPHARYSTCVSLPAQTVKSATGPNPDASLTHKLSRQEQRRAQRNLISFQLPVSSRKVKNYPFSFVIQSAVPPDPDHAGLPAGNHPKKALPQGHAMQLTCFAANFAPGICVCGKAC